MSAIARLEVIPVGAGSMTDAIAAALDALDAQGVRYETTATDTIIEAETAAAAFQAAQAAHDAVPGQRVVTSVEVDDDRAHRQGMAERVASVERARQRHGRQAAAQSRGGASAPHSSASGQHAAAADATSGGHPAYSRRYVDVQPGAPVP